MQDRDEQPVAATAVSFHSFPALGWPGTATVSPDRLTWPPAASARADRAAGPERAAKPALARGDGGAATTTSGETGTAIGRPDLDWLVGPSSSCAQQVIDAPAVSMPGLGGRFAAEWCPTSATPGRSGLRRERGRTDGGVMVRRAILDRGNELTADDEALPPSQLPAVRSDQAGAHWRGAGGRWLVWVARAIAWAVLLLIGYRGVLAILTGQASPTAASSPLPAGSTQFPVTLAEAYALQFGDVFLNFTPASATRRGQELARFVPPGTDTQLGWNGAGTQRLLAEQVAAISVKSQHVAVVTLLARLGSGSMIELGVPVYAAHGGIAVSGEPALLSGPARVTPPSGQQLNSDQATESALQSQLAAFFQAYASGDHTTLARFAAPGAHISGLGGTVTFSVIDSVYAPPGGNRRQISVTVSWQIPAAPGTPPAVDTAPAVLQMTYQMTVSRQGASWDVQSISASTTPEGPP